MEPAKKSRARLFACAGSAMAVAAASLALAAPASAVKVTGGTTLLKPNKKTFEGLADMSIGVEATGAAKFRRRGATFPVRGGKLKVNRPTPTGLVRHGGGLAFYTEGGPAVKFSKFAVELGRNEARLFAKSGGAAVRFLDIEGVGETAGGGNRNVVVIRKARAVLARQGAKVLRETFNFPFRKGIPLGKITLKANFRN